MITLYHDNMPSIIMIYFLQADIVLKSVILAKYKFTMMSANMLNYNE